MNRKKYLQLFFDKQLCKNLTQLFGESSYVKISNITYVRSKKSHLINITLFVDDPTKLDEVYPIGLEMLVQRAWSVVGDKKNIIIQSSFDLTQK
jgi:hypothetical protein